MVGVECAAECLAVEPVHPGTGSSADENARLGAQGTWRRLYRVLPSFTEFYRVLPRWALFSGATLTRSGPSSIQSFKEKGPYFRPLFVELP